MKEMATDSRRFIPPEYAPACRGNRDQVNVIAENIVQA